MNQFRIFTIVQCRHGSSRLKGKALMKLNGEPMIGHVIDRARAINDYALLGRDESIPVILATTDDKSDDGVAKAGKKHGAAVYRHEGPVGDVLGRMAEAARRAGARIIIRITGDCPLLAPDVAWEVVQLYCKNGGIATNDTNSSGWPDGLDVEVFPAGALYAAAGAAVSEEDREHVTPWIRAQLPHVILPGPPRKARLQRVKLSVDTKADFERVASVMAALKGESYGWESTFAAVRKAKVHKPAKAKGGSKKKAHATAGATA